MSQSTKTPRAAIEVYYSLQSDYCYFLLDRLIALERTGVKVVIRPVLGGVLRLPEKYLHRDVLEQQYFATDSQREAAYLNLPVAYPDPSPIAFKPGSLWVAEDEQPLNEYINRLFVGCVEAGRGLSFLDCIARMLWDGSTPGWHEGDHLARALGDIELNIETLLQHTPWDKAKTILDRNADAMYDAGHWGVPLMVFDGEPFYGQDRFDQLLWRMKSKGVAL